MIKQFITGVLILGSISLFSGCDEADPYLPSATILSAFDFRFPTATDIEWSEDDGLLKVTFYLRVATAQYPADNYEAWYDAKGQWMLATREVDQFTDLPSAVQSAYNQSKYATNGWSIEDLEEYYRPKISDAFLLEVTKSNQNYLLLFAENGSLVYEEKYNETFNQPELMPEQVGVYVEKKYPDANVIDYDLITEDVSEEAKIVYQEVELISDTVYYRLKFDLKDDLLQTSKEIAADSVPQPVRMAIDATYPAPWEVKMFSQADLEGVDLSLYEALLDNDEADTEKRVLYQADGTPYEQSL